MVIREQDGEQKIIQTVMTDKNGRYQFDHARPGKYVIFPENTDSDNQQVFKPTSRIVNVELLKKTNVPGFQVHGGAISGQIVSFNGHGLGAVIMQVDGVNKTTCDNQGIYYLNFKAFP